MVGIFKANKPTNHFVLFLYGLALKLPSFLYPVVPVAQEMDGYLYRLMLRWLEPFSSGSSLIYPSLSYLLVFFQAVAINKLVAEHRLMQRPSYLPGMSYLLITSLFAEWEMFSAPIVVNTLMVWALTQMCRLHSSTRPKTVLFNVGLAVGLASFFYFPTLSFFLLIFLGLFLTRPFRIAEWITAVLGGLVPYYFFAVWLYLTDRWGNYQLPGIHVSRPFFSDTTLAYIALGLITFSVLVGIYFVQSNLRRQLVQTRKNWSLIFVYLLASFIIPFFNINDRLDYWALVAVPASIFAAASFLYPTRKWYAVFMHWSMVALIVIQALKQGGAL